MFSIPLQFENFIKGLLTSMENEEVRKRLFIQECRYNLDLLAILKWKNDTKAMSEYILPKLKTEVAELMLAHFKNDILNRSLDQFNKIFDDNNEEPEPTDLLTLIINKVKMLKVIAEIPGDLQQENKSKLEVRVANLRTVLLNTIKTDLAR